MSSLLFFQLTDLIASSVDTIGIQVIGMAPAPQGSKRPVGTDRQGRALMVESCKRVKPWRELVASAALDAMAGRPLITAPCVMASEFLFLRPKGHYGARGLLKARAPRFHGVKPDGSKLQRSTEDALVGALLHDDSRIVAGPWIKRYCDSTERPGANITIYVLPS
jgi:crossover junction endodeoxyribonuclease RusA